MSTTGSTERRRGDAESLGSKGVKACQECLTRSEGCFGPLAFQGVAQWVWLVGVRWRLFGLPDGITRRKCTQRRAVLGQKTQGERPGTPALRRPNKAELAAKGCAPPRRSHGRRHEEKYQVEKRNLTVNQKPLLPVKPGGDAVMTAAVSRSSQDSLSRLPFGIREKAPPTYLEESPRHPGTNQGTSTHPTTPAPLNHLSSVV